MFESNHDVTVLNTLIATTIDSINGYEQSARETESGRFSTIFNERATERRQIVGELQAEVRRMGGEPKDDGSTLGGAHQAFLNLKAAMTGRDDQAVINEVERGEDYLKEKYETALKDDELSSQARAVIQRCYDSVRRGHDQMRDLKHSMQATG